MGQAIAVLTAAGAGTRLGARQPKALVQIHGLSLLQWSLYQMAQSGRIDAVIVTAPLSSLNIFRAEVQQLGIDMPVEVVAGGVSRQASVAAGLQELADFCDVLRIPVRPNTPTLVHDAARCFTPPKLINELVDVLDSGVLAVVPGLPVTDTIKMVADGGTTLSPVTATPPRNQLRAIQTPQAFHWEIIKGAHEQLHVLGADEASAATDDASLTEQFGVQVWVIPGDPRAMKITTREDLAAAADWSSGMEIPPLNPPRKLPGA